MTLTTARPAVLGDYLASKLGHGRGGEVGLATAAGRLQGQSTWVQIVFRNGKAARFSLESVETKTNRRHPDGRVLGEIACSGILPPWVRRGDRDHHVLDRYERAR